MNRRRRGVTSESFLIPIKAERDLIFLEERNDNVCVLEAVETILLFLVQRQEPPAVGSPPLQSPNASTTLYS